MINNHYNIIILPYVAAALTNELKNYFYFLVSRFFVVEDIILHTTKGLVTRYHTLINIFIFTQSVDRKIPLSTTLTY